MRLENPDTVDYLVVGKDGTYEAVLLDDFAGSDERRRLALMQAKLWRYLDFIESGEAYAHLDRMLGRAADRAMPVGIRIIAMQPLEALGQEFLGHVRQDAESQGIAVRFEVRAPGPDEVASIE